MQNFGKFNFQKISELLGNDQSNFNRRDVKSYLGQFKLKYALNISRHNISPNEWNKFMNSRFVADYPPTEEGFVKYYLRVKSRKIAYLK